MKKNDSYRVVNPIVLIIYNRPGLTSKVIEQLEKIQPKEIFVIADGPKKNDPEDMARCRATRDLIDNMQVDCDIHKNYSDDNMTGPKRIPSGLDWVFSKVEQAIILEHDCVPTVSFFRFCDEMLEYYKFDSRIGMISGNNLQKKPASDFSYYFSNLTQTWGWATWKRAWAYFDISISNWKELKDRKYMDNFFHKNAFKKYWGKIFERQYTNTRRHWDHAWLFTCWSQNMLTVVPQKNLASNIGFDHKATHSKNPLVWYANLPVMEMDFPLQHPPYVCRNLSADVYTQRFRFGPPPFYYWPIKTLKILLGKILPKSFTDSRKLKNRDTQG